MDPTNARPGRSVLLACVGLVVATFAVYGQVVDHEFITLDDDEYIVQNPMVRQGLSWKGLGWAFGTAHSANWHPLTWSSHMLDSELFGLRPGGHHLTSAALHAVTAILLFIFLVRATGAFWPALVVGAIFALHPLRVESVAWAAERKDVLAGLFWMLTLLAYVSYAKRPAIGKYLLVALALAMGLMAKPMLVSLPFVLLLLDVWPLRRFRTSGGTASRSDGESFSRLILEKAPLLALSVASMLVTLVAQKSSGAVRSFEILPLGVRLANAATAYVAYLWKTIWPTKLAVFYPHPAYLGEDPFSSRFGPALGAALLLAAITLLVLRQIGRRPYLAVGWLWYLGTLVPVIGIVQVGAQAMADRYTYLPLIGPAIAVVWAAAELTTRRPQARILLGVVAALLLSVCMAVTWRQVAQWRDSETLYRHALRVTSDNYLMHNSLGKVYVSRRLFDRSTEHLQETLRIKPDFADPYNTLAIVAIEEGRLDVAQTHLEHALSLWPEFAEAHNNLGTVLARQGRPSEAAIHFERASELTPFFADAQANLGMLLAEQGRHDEAAARVERALELAPDSPGIHNTFGRMLILRGELSLAAAQFDRALRLDPDFAEAHKNLGIVLARSGDLIAAAEQFDRALRLQPNLTEALRHLTTVAWMLATSPDPRVRNGEAAVRWAERLADITDRLDPVVLDALAAAHAEQGRWEEAVATAEAGAALAASSDQPVLSKQIESRLDLYRDHRPFRAVAPDAQADPHRRPL